MCKRLGLVDVTDTLNDNTAENVVAAAVFTPGQRLEVGKVVNDVAEALRQVDSGWSSRDSQLWSLVLLDLQFDHGAVRNEALDPDFNWPECSDQEHGLKIMDALSRRWPDRRSENGNCEIPVVILSRLDRVEKGKQAGRAGALAYVEKEDLDRQRLIELLDEHGLIEDPSGMIEGKSPVLLRTLRAAREAARRAQGNLLLLGPPGSGKSMLAEYIHRHSSRVRQPLQRITVGAGINPDMLKAQLYGYWYGAHNLASTSEAGLAERAHRGTLFLDEIANLPATGQTELLEFARCSPDGTRALVRFGSFPSNKLQITQARQSVIGDYDSQTQRIHVDVFLITATNQPLNDPSFYKRSDFRQDLFVRLGQESHRFIEFPPLSQRPEDIAMLFERFLAEATEAHGGRWPKSLDPEVVERLRQHDWPGNVAELRGVALEAEKASRDWDEVLGRHLPTLCVNQPSASPPAQGVSGPPVPAPSVAIITQILSAAHVTGRRSELTGSLVSINRAFGELQLRLLKAALEETRRQTGQAKSDLLGDLNPTTAVSLLLGRPITTPQAADEIKRIMSLIEVPPEPASDLGRVFSWAQGRRGKARKSLTDQGRRDDK
jgi:DNA-binding NtrC family response regulator